MKGIIIGAVIVIALGIGAIGMSMENSSKNKRIEAMYQAIQSLPEDQRKEAFDKAAEQATIINASGDIFGKTGR